MSESHPPSLSPRNAQDMASVTRLSTLSQAEFAAVAPSLLPWMGWRNNRDSLIMQPLNELFVSRLTATTPSPTDPLVSVIVSALVIPATTPTAAGLKHPLLHNILSALPKDRIKPYRSALARMATSPTEAEAESTPWPPSLSERSAEILDFLDTSHAWVPRTKADDLALRSLELVESAEDMKPHVKGMLGWLEDRNWPPAAGCWAQLARFPELALDPIREVLRNGDNGDWSYNVLQFLEQSMPGELREMARVEVERIAQCPTQSEIDNDAVEAANDCLKAMDDWADRAKMDAGYLPEDLSMASQVSENKDSKAE
ncbi:hypothetical protein K438DRAFT_1757271 [Mycena galopus ATCC 62051]|nr:hypothetical protein K438DRAFT_1757271 [Mycena galopus ATCC 62051]